MTVLLDSHLVVRNEITGVMRAYQKFTVRKKGPVPRGCTTVDGLGTIVTVAGDSTPHRYSGDGGAAISAQLASPEGVALDAVISVCAQ